MATGSSRSSSSSSSSFSGTPDCSVAHESGSRSDSDEAAVLVEGADVTEVLWVRGGVAVRPSRQHTLLGRLSVVKQHGLTFLSWLPYASSSSSSSSQPASTTTTATTTPDETAAAAPPPPAAAAAAQNDGIGDPRLYAVPAIALSDVRVLLAHASQLVIVLRSGLTLPPLELSPADLTALLAVLQQHANLAPAAHNDNPAAAPHAAAAGPQPTRFLVNEQADPLVRSLVSLDLVDIALGAPPPGARCVAPPPGSQWQQRRHSRRAGGSSSGALARGLEACAASAPAKASAAAAAVVAAAVASVGSRRARQAQRSIDDNQKQQQQPQGEPGGSDSASEAGASALDGSPDDGSSSSLAGGSDSPGGSRPQPWRSAVLASWGLLDLGGSAAAVAGQVGGLSGVAAAAMAAAGRGLRTAGAAAVSGWAADVLRHYEEDVVLPEDSSEATSAAGAAPAASGQPDSSSRRAAQPLDIPGTSPAAASARLASSDSAATAAGDVAHTLVGSFELLGGDVLPQHLLLPHIAPPPEQQQPPLSLQELQQQLMDAHGVLRGGPAALRQRVFDCGVEPAARHEVWPLLLGVFSPDSSAGSRAAVRQQQGEQYTALLAGWKRQLGPGSSSSRQQAAPPWQQDVEPQPPEQQQQEERDSEQHNEQQQQLRRVQRGRIQRDVKRTDRGHPLFSSGDRGAGRRLRALRNILRAWCVLDDADASAFPSFSPDDQGGGGDQQQQRQRVGYCQGMSDLAAPLLVAVGCCSSGSEPNGDGHKVDEVNEAAAFACFAALMRRMGSNFALDQHGMRGQLAALRQLVQVLDPQLHACLEEGGANEYFFAFRWLLVAFKREFLFEQVLALWEACWACPMTPHLHLFFAAAILIQHRRLLLSQQPHLDSDTLLAWVIEGAGRWDLPSLKRVAAALVVVSGPAGAHCCEGLEVAPAGPSH